MSKLFEIPASKRKVVFYLETYKGNRIAIKLMKLIKKSSNFFVDDVESSEDSRIFEISIFSDKDLTDLVAELKDSIISKILTDTPENYLFDFKDRRLGFINSFNVFSENGFHFEVCHKIKEVRTNGGTNIPVKKINV